MCLRPSPSPRHKPPDPSHISGLEPTPVARNNTGWWNYYALWRHGFAPVSFTRNVFQDLSPVAGALVQYIHRSLVAYRRAGCWSGTGRDRGCKPSRQVRGRQPLVRVATLADRGRCPPLGPGRDQQQAWSASTRSVHIRASSPFQRGRGWRSDPAPYHLSGARGVARRCWLPQPRACQPLSLRARPLHFDRAPIRRPDLRS
jgi:hypothetical protein